MRREPGDVRPDYVIVADELRHQITSGALAIGDQLPSQMAIRDTYGTTQATAQKAMELLKEEGYVLGSVGRGTYVVSTVPRNEQSDALRMMTDVHRRLDELEATVRELKNLVSQRGGSSRRPRPTHA